MTDMEKAVLAFLKEWLAWAEAGGHGHAVFDNGMGLCGNAFNYGELQPKYFREEFGFGMTPFGKDYADRACEGTQHECPKRLTWVRAKIEELEMKGWNYD